MKLKDLPGETDLCRVKFINPYDGQEYWWHSQWGNGIWAKKDLNSPQIYPIFFDSLDEILEFEVVFIKPI